MRNFFISLFIFCLSTGVNAVGNIEVQGLFSNKAVILIDGKRHILAVGMVSPEGVKVISANSSGAVLEIDGQQKQYTLGDSSTINTKFKQRGKRQEKIYVNSGGMYMTYGNINGRSVQFLIDTGASAISMNTDQAKHLGIRYDKYGIPAGVSTASGYADAYKVRLKSVSVGDITQTNVEAFVIDGKHPGPILLGMTFLGRLDVEHSGNAMTLTQEK
jgi:aspartyl protease family protein